MAPAKKSDPMATYELLNNAFEFFNKELFAGKLSPCLIVLQRHRSYYGYFCASRMAGADAKKSVHEIALNPKHIRDRKPRETLSTFVHEMVHQNQQEHGKPPKGVYHNREWAKMMHVVGLHPSTTGKPDGAETGRKCSHYIVAKGPFAVAYEKFEKKNKLELFGDLPEPLKKKNAPSKFKFACAECEQVCWAKEGANLHCGDCETEMELQT